MAETKVARAAEIVLKNPEITNLALAKKVKAANPMASGWQLRQRVEKYIDRKGLRPTEKTPKMMKKKDAPMEAPSSKVSPDKYIKSLGGKIEVQGKFISIKIPTKSLSNILLSKLLH
ncbi:MAG TPA: hypothetical protein VE954_43380 [Oligoflexus sp.]|uniref:hypothetical protein n=1 Tax=Oligoflexus sp. TaxID=1971216 RepID=UPI002D41E1CE|nr:hypothetical protein [Oligoflexus sp.]HYX39988.1 hypothetical protein [Oligoflexus sp.]